MRIERLEVGVDVLRAVLGVDEPVEPIARDVVAVAIVDLDDRRPGRQARAAARSGGPRRRPGSARPSRVTNGSPPVASSQMGESPGSTSNVMVARPAYSVEPATRSNARS